MADSQNENAILVWMGLGAGAGLVLLGKMKFAGVVPHDDPLKSAVIIGVGGGAVVLFGKIGEHLHTEVAREKISWATYWTTVFGIAVAAFTLLGITGVDDLFALFRKAG
ncbi:hypothetical protein ACH4SP_00555 [Streptomyces sp. NPDC021093]|uniref:hypothetical protein n=1 Tax=Streptomyces sp. NPDC021093 TaxID=3365112 RepID=UPI0037BB0C84